MRALEGRKEAGAPGGGVRAAGREGGPAPREMSGCVGSAQAQGAGWGLSLRELRPKPPRPPGLSRRSPHCLAHPISIIRCGFRFCRSGWGLSTCISEELPARWERPGPRQAAGLAQLELTWQQLLLEMRKRPQLLWGFETEIVSAALIAFAEDGQQKGRVGLGHMAAHLGALCGDSLSHQSVNLGPRSWTGNF